MGRTTALSDGEWKLMDRLWQSPGTITELTESLQPRTGWQKNTVITMLARLEKKGAVRHEAATVTPLLTRQEALRAQGEEVVERAGGLPLFLTAFLSGRRLTAQEAEDLKRLIDEKMGDG